MHVDEYRELNDLIVAGRYPEALALLAELDAMGRKADRRVLRSLVRVLLVHLIKRAEAGRSTRSWDRSIANARDEIRDENARETGGTYFSRAELEDLVRSSWAWSVRNAAVEVARGRYTTRELEQRVDREAILAEALALIAGDAAPGD
ncbi:MAG: DUF29 family protein [Planctomycetaceae bacterium]|nr:DUF29 family protein [Planctomycetaceae bacterium]